MQLSNKNHDQLDIWNGNVDKIFLINGQTGNGGVNDMQDVSSSPRKDRNKFHYFHFFIKVGYYCLIMPYDVQHNAVTGSMEIVEVGKIQKIIVLIVCIFPVMYTFAALRQALDYAIAKRLDMLSYFILGNAISFVILFVVYYAKLFRGRMDMENLSNNIRECSLLKRSGKLYLRRWALVIGFHLTFAIIEFLREFTQDGWSFSGVFKHLLESGSYMLFLNGNVHTSEDLDAMDYTASNILVAFAALPVELFCNIQIPLQCTMLFTLTLTMFEAASELMEMVQEKDDKNLEFNASFIRVKFKELQSLSRSINDMWGSACLCLLFNNFAYYCTFFHQTVLEPEYLPKLRFGLQTVHVGMSLVLSAKCSAKADDFSRYLAQRLRREEVEEEREDLEILLIESKKSMICLGMEDVYKVDYRLIYEEIVLLLTFFFIFLQSYTINPQKFDH